MWLIILLVMLILPIWASINVKSTFSKYSTVQNSRGLTAEQVARQILDSAVIVQLEREVFRHKKHRLMPLLPQLFYENAVKFYLMTSRHDNRL